MDLESLLTPDRLRSIYKLKFPWDRSQAPTGQQIWDDGDTNAWRQLCFDSLVALSQLGLDNVPDFFKFLPEPQSVEFLEQALGLVLLLDQSPGIMLSGVDTRWTSEYFNYLAQRLSLQLKNLPPDQRIDRQGRWIDELGYTFEHWVAIRIFIPAPFTHSESIDLHKFQNEQMEEVRVAVERRTGRSDPYRPQDLANSKDTLAFHKLVRAQWPQTDKFEDFAFWMLAVCDAHTPLIRVFGRYPYQNASSGRDCTTEEEEWFLRNGSKNPTETEWAKKIREDVRAGYWTPLGA